MNSITRIFALPVLVSGIAILPSSVFAVNDGTYKVYDVTSSEQCSALCSGDKTCRGWSLLQPDTRLPNAQCSLNDGIADQSPFKIAPAPLIESYTIIEDMNAYRAEHGLGPLIWNEVLVTASKVHSDDLASTGTISHDGSDGSSPSQRVTRQGYKYRFTAENVATGQKSWDDVFMAWQKSPGHNENLLSPHATEIGVAITYEPTTLYINYWTMVLASPLK